MASPEKEVERLLMALVPETDFAGKVFSVEGFVRDNVIGLE